MEDPDRPDHLVPPPRGRLVHQDGREELVDLVLLDVLETMGLVLKVNQVNQDRIMDWCPEEPHPKGMLVLLVFLALTVVLEIPDPSVHRDLLHAKLLFRDRLVRLVRPVHPVHPEDLSNKDRERMRRMSKSFPEP